MQVRLVVLDEKIDQRIELLKAQRQKAPPHVNIELLAASARDIIACENVLDMFADDISRRIAGEVRNAKLAYLVGTSRLFGEAMHCAVKGPSSAGKSILREQVLKYFPQESLISFTSLSERALIYEERDFQHVILSMGEAQSKEEISFQDYLLRELMSENKIVYKVPVKVGSKIQTTTIEKHGPVAFFVTTTRNKLHNENETRLLSLDVDESAEQTRKVLRKIAVVKGFNRVPAEADLKPWGDYQRFLAAVRLSCHSRQP